MVHASAQEQGGESSTASTSLLRRVETWASPLSLFVLHEAFLRIWRGVAGTIIMTLNQARKRHIKHKQIFPVTAWWGGVSRPGGEGVSRLVARGQKFMCCVRNPRNINIFVRVPGQEDRVPGREDR